MDDMAVCRRANTPDGHLSMDSSTQLHILAEVRQKSDQSEMYLAH